MMFLGLYYLDLPYLRHTGLFLVEGVRLVE